MPRREEIKEYWKIRAINEGNDPRSTIKDHEFREMEIAIISRYLKPTDVVLDIGCGNGFSTFCYLENVSQIIGVDYIQEFIDWANRLYLNDANRNKLRFLQADVLALPFNNDQFDVVLSERTLINLSTWEDQMKALKNIWRVLKKGGRLILLEVSVQGMAKLDEMREKFGIEEMKKHWHNLYIDENMLQQFLVGKFAIKDIKRFGIYCLISKIVHPLLVAPEIPQYGAKINKIASLIGREYIDFDGGASHQFMYVLGKI